MQRLRPCLQILLVLFIPLRNARIKIPAVVVEAKPTGKLLDFRSRLFLEVEKAHYHVGHLHTSVVDVVLDIDVPARELQQAHESIAEHCVSQVPDVGGLVGIYAGVLNQNLAGGNLALGLCI